MSLKENYGCLKLEISFSHDPTGNVKKNCKENVKIPHPTADVC